MYWLRPFYAFRGRTNRARFWIVSLTWFLVSGVASMVWIDSGAEAVPFGSNHLLDAAAVAGAVLPLLSCIAVSVTRLHDRNKSGWWLIVYGVLPAVIEVVAAASVANAALFVAMMLAVGVLSLWAFIELGCLRGSIGANAYGPDPLAGLD
jgi:uncharacterized membrane protein YhaH (DUF805 family)